MECSKKSDSLIYNPKTVFLHFPYICNLKCSFCDISLNTPQKIKKMSEVHSSFRLWKIAIDKLRKWKRKFPISFIAGEPLMHKDILKIVKYAEDKGCRTSFTTNGTLITENVAKNIIKSGLSFIAFSLDFSIAKLHNTYRGDGVFERTLRGLELLLSSRKKKPIIYINTIIMKKNVKYLSEMVKFADRIGVDGITFQPIASSEFFGRNMNIKNIVKISPRIIYYNLIDEMWFKKSEFWPEFRLVKKSIEDLVKMKKDGYPIKNTYEDLHKFIKYFRNPIRFGENEKCNALMSMSIMPNLDVKICPSFIPIGNLLKEEMKDILKKPIVKFAIKHVKKCRAQCKILAVNKEDFYFS